MSTLTVTESPVVKDEHKPSSLNKLAIGLVAGGVALVTVVGGVVAATQSSTGISASESEAAIALWKSDAQDFKACGKASAEGGTSILEYNTSFNSYGALRCAGLYAHMVNGYASLHFEHDSEANRLTQDVATKTQSVITVRTTKDFFARDNARNDARNAWFSYLTSKGVNFPQNPFSTSKG